MADAETFLAAINSDAPLEGVTGIVNLLADVEASNRSTALLLKALCSRVWESKDDPDALMEACRDIAAAQDEIDRRTAQIAEFNRPLFLFLVEQKKAKLVSQITVH
jgi:hypothetical protein